VSYKDASSKAERARKIDFEEYPDWLQRIAGDRIGPRTETYYRAVVNDISRRFRESEVWRDLSGGLRDLERRYYLETGYDLFSVSEAPELETKPYGSFLLKTYRKNVLENPSWPDPPDSGWILPSLSFEEINDLVRCRVVVKYLDGVSTVLDWIGSVCEDYETRFVADLEAKEEGYYAAHGYVVFPCHIPDREFDTKEIRAPIEIQVTTQVQDLIYRLLHKYYEERRKTSEHSGICWQWDYETEEFAANYLGHILHYVEGMIMDIRRRQEDGYAD